MPLILTAGLTYQFTPPQAWIGIQELLISAGLLICALLTAIGVQRGSITMRTYTAIGPFSFFLFYLLLRFVGIDLMRSNEWKMGHTLVASAPAHLLILCGMTILTIVGIWRAWIGARWLAMALAGAGLISSGLNGFDLLHHRALHSWVYLVSICGSALILINLSGHSMHAATLARQPENSIWRSDAPMIRKLRWSILANLVAIPMLLVYGWLQPIVAATKNIAFILAGVLALASILAIARKVIGAVLLSLGGIALLVLTIVTISLADTKTDPYALMIASYYAVFWLPGAIFSAIAGISLAKPVTQLLRKD